MLSKQHVFSKTEMAPGGVSLPLSGVKKPCKKCKNVPRSGLKCVKCSAIMHPGCVKYLKNVKLIDDKHIDCCESDPSYEDVDHVVDIRDERDCSNVEVNKLLLEKDIVIKSLKETVNALKEQILLMKSTKINRKSNNNVPDDTTTPSEKQKNYHTHDGQALPSNQRKSLKGFQSCRYMFSINGESVSTQPAEQNNKN